MICGMLCVSAAVVIMPLLRLCKPYSFSGRSIETHASLMYLTIHLMLMGFSATTSSSLPMVRNTGLLAPGAVSLRQTSSCRTGHSSPWRRFRVMICPTPVLDTGMRTTTPAGLNSTSFPAHRPQFRTSHRTVEPEQQERPPLQHVMSNFGQQLDDGVHVLHEQRSLTSHLTIIEPAFEYRPVSVDTRRGSLSDSDQVVSERGR